MLSIKNIDVTLGKNTKLERKVLHKLNLNIKEGEFVVLIGGNGAGKSTVLDLVAGSINPDCGKIFMLNEDVTNKSQIYKARLVSKVMQDPKLGTIENMTIFENMAFALKKGEVRGMSLFFNKKRVDLFKEKLAILSMGLENCLDQLVGNLSGGQRQALSLIMAIVRDSPILLLDEITAALDPLVSESIMELTNKIIREQKNTCIMVTHNMAHAIKYGDRLLLLKNGNFVIEYDAVKKSKLTQANLATQFGEL
jgi:putative tryptophan/tyrosine transport system ATP-binding protein